MAQSNWEQLREVECSTEVGPRHIELSKELAEKVGARGEIRVRCKPPTADQGGAPPANEKARSPGRENPLEHPPELILRIDEGSTTHAAVAPSNYRALGVPEFGLKIEGRRLALTRRGVRLAIRLALPTLIVVAAIAALIGLLWSKSTFVTEVVTAAAATIAAVVAGVKAWTEP